MEYYWYKWIFVQLKAWCHQATGHYLSQCLPVLCFHTMSLGHNELILQVLKVLTSCMHPILILLQQNGIEGIGSQRNWKTVPKVCSHHCVCWWLLWWYLSLWQKNFPCYWPFVRGIHQSLMNSPHRGQLHGTLMFSLICAWTNGWVNNRDFGDLRCHRSHYDFAVMSHCNPPISFGIMDLCQYWMR